MGPGSFGVAEDELFDLFELVDAEDAPGVFAVGAGFFAEAGAVAGVSVEGSLLVSSGRRLGGIGMGWPAHLMGRSFS